MLEKYRLLYLQLCGLTTFRSILQLPAVQALMRLLSADEEAPARQAYGQLLYTVREAGFQDFSAYLMDHLRYDESAFGRACAQGCVDDFFEEAARKDVSVLNCVAQLSFNILKQELARSFSDHRQELCALPELPTGKSIQFEELCDSYIHNGVGIFARGRAFLWENGSLSMVRNLDSIDQLQMIGYTWQRQEVVKNTALLLAGKTANNVLLHGDSGTGKSATIKSLVNIPEFYNLRVVEVAKSSLGELTQLVRLVSEHTQKFILYIDDLTFEKEDRGYSALKTALEGGLENRPGNVAIYATSNRRHLVRETFADRQGGDIHREETIQERTSLSDRFGLRIVYLALNQKEYFDMVEQMAQQAGIKMEPERLRREANQWELQHGGRTPRVARQFVDSLHAK